MASEMAQITCKPKHDIIVPCCQMEIILWYFNCSTKHLLFNKKPE